MNKGSVCRGRALRVTLGGVALLSFALFGCSAPSKARPAMIEQVAAGAAGAANAEQACEQLPVSQPDACMISWACPDLGQLTFVCFDEAAGSGCGCMVDETFTDGFTADLSACGDAVALAALARTTCGWDVP